MADGKLMTIRIPDSVRAELEELVRTQGGTMTSHFLRLVEAGLTAPDIGERVGSLERRVDVVEDTIEMWTGE